MYKKVMTSIVSRWCCIHDWRRLPSAESLAFARVTKDPIWSLVNHPATGFFVRTSQGSQQDCWLLNHHLSFYFSVMFFSTLFVHCLKWFKYWHRLPKSHVFHSCYYLFWPSTAYHLIVGDRTVWIPIVKMSKMPNSLQLKCFPSHICWKCLHCSSGCKRLTMGTMSAHWI